MTAIPSGRRSAANFACTCGCGLSERVIVARADGSLYSTEFVKCAICGAVFHFVPEPPAPSPQIGAAFRLTASEHFVAPDDLAAINAAADRARKSRKRK